MAAPISKTSKSLQRRTLSSEAVELIAARFKVLSEPARIHLIMALETGEQNVSDLVRLTSISQTNVSRHLQALARAGVVDRRKQGTQVYYHIADAAIFVLCDHVCGSLLRHFNTQARSVKALGST
jgi:DNA-binding transcriptional ArsR family regulator